MKDKNIFASFGPKSNRITTLFTSKKRELRQFCKIDGEKLESLDLKSSQPYILAIHFLRKHPAESKRFYNDVVHNDIYTIFLDHARKEGLTKFKVWNGAYM